MRHQLAVLLILASCYPALAEAPEGEKPVRKDLYGDPLPDGAIARLGTLRWRAGKSLDAITFASDGNTIACASYCGLWLFDKANGWLLKHIPFPRNFERLAFSPDGTRLACSGTVLDNHVKSVVQIWELPGWRKVRNSRQNTCSGLAGRPMASRWPFSWERT
jgi:hypothetical protein